MASSVYAQFRPDIIARVLAVIRKPQLSAWRRRLHPHLMLEWASERFVEDEPEGVSIGISDEAPPPGPRAPE